MFERILFSTLTENLRKLAGNARALKAFTDTIAGLNEKLNEPERVQDLIKAFAAQEKPVIHGYARDDTEFPCWSIVLANGTEDLRFLSDETGDNDDDGHPIKESIWSNTYQVLVYSKHPDVCLYFYKLAKALFLQSRTEMIELGGMVNVGTVSGAELQPDRVYLPAFLFVRALSITVLEEDEGVPDLALNDEPLPATAVGGLHIRDDSRPPDGVSHNIFVYTDESE